MPVLAIDIETYSEVDLTKSGVYAYADSESFEILLFAYAFDDEPTTVVDLKCGEQLPQRVLDALVDSGVTKTAFNAAFERTCLSKYLGVFLSPLSWQCTAVQSAMLALPLSLEGVGEVLDIERKKIKEGADLVRYFSFPCKPTKANGERRRNLPEHDPEKWRRFKAYCIRDVDAEREIRQKLKSYPIPEREQALYLLDQEINDRGIMVDPMLVDRAVECDLLYKEHAARRAYELTGLDNPNSIAQVREWLSDQGIETESLDKKAVKSLLPETDGEVLEMLKLRLLMAKTSVKKYEAIRRSVCLDGRVHGLLQFYGANRTGRWCLTGDHEVLTDKGWMRLDAWHGGKIACWNPIGETVSFQEASAVCFPYSGDMYEYSDKRIAQVSTPDHRMYHKHTKGEFHGKPFKLLPWQQKIIGDVFGTVRDDDPAIRQFTTAYIEIPKKMGKSELGAAIALNMLVNDDEWKAEVYSCASDRQQAAIVFDVAVDMVKQSPALMKRIKIIPSMKRMVYQPTGSIYQVLSSEVATKHGLNVSACIFDELHTQPTRALYDVMTQGSGDARRQPLWFLLTTAGTDRTSICWEVHQKALDILEGRKADPRFYPVIFGLPDDADWSDEKNWYIANPSLGHTIDIEKVRDAYRKALETPADENMFRQLRLNQWVKQSIRWMPMDKWDECGGVVDPYELEGRACYAGLDLSSTSDLTTVVLVFPPRDEEEPYTVLPFFWLPEDTLQLRVRRDHVMYDTWERQGYIQTTEGNVVHYGFIEAFICQMGERYNIREIAYDRWNATQMVQNLEGDGFTMVPFGQGFKDMSPPSKELMRIVLERKLNHGGHPVLRWNFDNVYVRTDPAGNIKPDKEKSTEKIDGVVALVMALDRAMKNGNGGASVYDDRGFLVLG